MRFKRIFLRPVCRLFLNLSVPSVMLCCVACSTQQGNQEQMVDLQEVKDNPEAQLVNLNAAIAQSKRDGSLFTRRAVILFKDNKLPEALQDINEAIRLTKNEPYNLFVKAQVLRAMGRYEEALPLALQAERNSYTNSSLYVLLGEMYLRRGEYAEARKYIQKAQELSPSNEFAFYYKGRVLEATGDTAYAVDNYKAALRENPGLMEPKRELAGIFVRQLNLQEARPYLQEAYRQAPDDALLSLYRGLLYEAAHKADSSQLFLKRAVALNDTLQEAHYKLGLVLYARGDNFGAIAHLEKAAKAYGGTTKYSATLASAYERTEQNIKSLQEYQRLTQLEPTYTYAYQAVARLRYKLQRQRADSTAAARNRTLEQ